MIKVKPVSIPFKREGVSKDSIKINANSERQAVSIPFKREGVSKVMIREYIYKSENSFHSLQTGRCIQSK